MPDSGTKTGHDGSDVPPDPARIEDALEHLEDAVDELLAAGVALGGLPASTPVAALDWALLVDPVYQAARTAASAAWAPLTDGADPRLAMRAEETVNALVVAACDVGYRLGIGHRIAALQGKTGG